MIFILEGPNKTGKTTLAQYLMDNYGFAYFKDSVDLTKRIPANERIDEMFTILMSQAKLLVSISKACNLVVDRFHLTEEVYGFVDRGYRFDMNTYVEAVLLSARDDIKLVCLKPRRYQPGQIICNNEDMYRKFKIEAMYQEVFNSSALKKEQVCIDDGPEYIMDVLQLNEEGKKLPPFKRGDPNGKVVVQ